MFSQGKSTDIENSQIIQLINARPDTPKCRHCILISEIILLLNLQRIGLAKMASSSSEQNKGAGNLVKLQENASVFKVVLVVAICILNAASNGMASGYATTGAVMYTTSNATSLVEPVSSQFRSG